MKPSVPGHLHTALAQGLTSLFKQLEDRLSLGRPVKVYLAGGMAVHLYTGSRVTHDVDAEFSGRIFIPSDLMVAVERADLGLDRLPRASSAPVLI